MSNYTILYVGPLKFGSTSYHRYCSLCSVNHRTEGLDTTIYNKALIFFYKLCLRVFKIHLDLIGINKKILNFQFDYNGIIIIDKGLTIKRQTLIKLKSRYKSLKVISYSPDDMMNIHNQSRQYLNCISHYDIHYTTKSYNVKELSSLGAKKVEYVNNAFSEIFHTQINLDGFYYKYDISFIGSYEEERLHSLEKIIEKFVDYKIFIAGNWKSEHYEFFKNSGLDFYKGELVFPTYNQVVSQSKINLCFLRKVNRDLQTTRSIEIPAMGGFMLAEYSSEHESLFESNVEASYFESDDQLIEKIDYYLKNEEIRETIKKRGYKKCLNADYSNRNLMSSMIKSINSTDGIS